MHDGKPIDLSAQVERVKRRTRPWKAIIALVLAIAAAYFSHQASRAAKELEQHAQSSTIFTYGHLTDELIAAGLAVAFLVFGSIATLDLAGKSREILEPKAGASHSAVVRYAILLIGAFTTLVVALELFSIPVGQLVLGGALTSVFVGIAAQQSLGNVFAGLVLLFARPFQVGEAVRLRAGALGGTLDGIVTEIGITYVRFDTGGSVVAIPNSQVLNAVVGPVPPDSDNAPAPAPAPVAAAPAVADTRSGTPGGPEQRQPSPGGPP